MVDCARLQESIDKHGERFLKRVFTPVELEYCLGKKREIEHLAGRFAAKEAVLKVLGTGWRNGINWTDIEVFNERLNQSCCALGKFKGEHVAPAVKLFYSKSMSFSEAHQPKSINCMMLPQDQSAWNP